MGNSCSSKAQEPFETFQPPRASTVPQKFLNSAGPFQPQENVRAPKKVSAHQQQSGSPFAEPTTSNVHYEPEFMKYITDFQEKTYQRLEHDFHENWNLFILNQLLLSFQFFDNFDRCKAEAERIKTQKEETITQRLAEHSSSGPLGGSKSVILVNAMGEVLSNFYFYKPKNESESAIHGTEENGDMNFKTAEPSSSKSQPREALNTTFVHNSILPLEFFVTLDEFEPQMDTVITSPVMPLGPGDPSKIKCYMEEPHRTNKTAKGFVRLRVSGPGTTVALNQEDTDTYYSGGGTGTYENTSERFTSILSEDYDEHGKSFNDIESRLTDAASYSLPPMNSNGRQITHAEDYDAISDNFFIGTPTGRVSSSRSNSKPKTATINPTPDIIPDNDYSPHRSRSGLSDTTFLPSVHLQAEHTADHRQPVKRNKFELKKLSDYKKITLPASEHRVHPYILVQVKTIPLENEDNLHDGMDDEKLQIQELLSKDLQEQEKAELNKEKSDDDNSVIKIQRTYLNSTTISDIFVGEFTTWGDQFGIPDHDLRQAEVFAATIRSCVTTTINEETFHQLYTITPVIHNKSWPQQAFKKFLEAMFKEPEPPYLSGSNEHGPYSIHWKNFVWLTNKQVHNLVNRGCDLVPRGYRGIFFNSLQSLEWQVEFPLAENLLLDTLKRVHWRLYITMAILFRSYVSTLGPKGINLEHIRHLLYAKCYDDFFRWYDEEPGKQLIQLMDAFYTSLADRQLDNFFMPKCNMLRSTSFHDAVVVQYSLRKVQENMLKYTIKSFRDLHWLKTPGEKFWPKLDLSKLYKLVTLEDDNCTEYILQSRIKDNSGLFFEPTKESLRGQKSSSMRSKAKDKRRKERKWKDIPTIGMNVDGPRGPTDAYQEYRKKELKRHAREMRAKLAREKQQEVVVKSEPELGTSSEKRQSIDLNQDIVKDYKDLRVSAIVEMFILQFLRMGETALELEAYPEATMYALHVLNMCKLVKLNGNASKLIHTNDRENFETRAHDILKNLGPKKEEYIRSKLRDAGTEDTAVFVRGFLSQGNEPLPSTPKEPEVPQPSRQPGILKLDRSRIGESVKFLPQPSKRRMEPVPRIQEEENMSEDQEEPGTSQVTQPPPPPAVPPKPKRTPSVLSQNTRPRKVREIAPPPQDYDSTDSDDKVKPILAIKLLNINHGNFMKRSPSFFAEKAAQNPVSSDSLY